MDSLDRDHGGVAPALRDVDSSPRPTPFVLSGQHSPEVRLYTIGPEHLDWVCVFCGKTGNLDGDRISRLRLVLDQINIVKAIEGTTASHSEFKEHWERTAWLVARWRCARTAIEHMQRHLRFEWICQKDSVDEWPFEDDPPDPL